jgi:hypothetical protein
MDRHIVVLGTDHSLQGVEKAPPNKKINDPTYRVLVEKLIRDYVIECIFEEASGNGATTASVLQSPGLRYFAVDPAGPDRKSLGIPDGLLFEGYSIYEINDPRMPSPEPLATQKKADTEFAREKVWVERIARENFTSGLMICGCAHTFSLAFRLVDSGFSVDVVIYMGPTLMDLLTRVSACKSEQDFGPVINDMKSWTTFEPISGEK